MSGLADILGVELPIIQSPMAGVQDHELAVAVAGVGGLGSRPCATLTPDAAPYYAELGIGPGTVPAGAGRVPFSAAAAEQLAAFRPAIVSFHFGLPEAAVLAPLRAWGAKILASATAVAEAVWLEAREVDAVIAQGLEARPKSRGLSRVSD
jgi:nitronate monooxygenase